MLQDNIELRPSFRCDGSAARDPKLQPVMIQVNTWDNGGEAIELAVSAKQPQLISSLTQIAKLGRHPTRILRR